MRMTTAILVALWVFAASPGYAEEVVSAADESAAQQTLETFTRKDSGIQAFLDQSVGYAVFPKVGKAGFVLGGAYGKGVVYEHGKVIGATSITEGKIGLVVGVESFSELVVFQTDLALNRLKEGRFETGAQASAVVASAGAASASAFRNGIAVFITDQGGLMGDASVGAQKFSFKPIAE
jgi:lipid-binding SYLF domain-containing protein